MLAELMAFNGEKFPPPEELPPIYKWSTKLSKSKNKSLILKNKDNSTNDNKTDERSLSEKVLQRQIEEHLRLEEKKKKILKELHKKKRINIKKFLTREAGYEQKKIYNLEQQRLKKLEEENKNFRDKPLLSAKTIEICKNKKKKKKPIYLRTNEILETKKKNLENLNNKIKEEKIKANKLNKSMDEINLNNTNNEDDSIYIVNNEIKDKKMTLKESNDYYQKQFEWKNKLNERISDYDIIKTEIEEKRFKTYFHPKLSRGTEEIILAMNEAKENHLNQTLDSKNNNNSNNYFFTEATPNPNYLNYNNDVFNRLYENKKIDRLNKYQLFFQPITNKNKNRKILPKYQEYDKFTLSLKKFKVKKNHKKHKSIDTKSNKNKKSKKEFNESSDKKEDNQFEPWTYYLSKLKNNKSCEISYKLNIRQGSAWNENDLNIVPYKGESREIIKYFL